MAKVGLGLADPKALTRILSEHTQGVGEGFHYPGMPALHQVP